MNLVVLKVYFKIFNSIKIMIIGRGILNHFFEST